MQRTLQFGALGSAQDLRAMASTKPQKGSPKHTSQGKAGEVERERDKQTDRKEERKTV